MTRKSFFLFVRSQALKLSLRNGQRFIIFLLLNWQIETLDFLFSSMPAMDQRSPHVLRGSPPLAHGRTCCPGLAADEKVSFSLPEGCHSMPGLDVGTSVGWKVGLQPGQDHRTLTLGCTRPPASWLHASQYRRATWVAFVKHEKNSSSEKHVTVVVCFLLPEEKRQMRWTHPKSVSLRMLGLCGEPVLYLEFSF